MSYNTESDIKIISLRIIHSSLNDRYVKPHLQLVYYIFENLFDLNLHNNGNSLI